jgi:hypothetical protein
LKTAGIPGCELAAQPIDATKVRLITPPPDCPFPNFLEEKIQVLYGFISRLRVDRQ